MIIKETEYLSKSEKFRNFFLFYKGFLNKNLLIIVYLLVLKIVNSIIKRILEKLSYELIKENLGWHDI